MNKIFSEKTLTAAFLKIAIEDVLTNMKPFMANNKKASENFFADVIAYVRSYRHNKNPYYGMNYRSVREVFGKFGINNGIELVNVLITNKSEFDKHTYPLLASGIKKLKNLRSNGENRKKFKSYTHYDGLDPERTLAVRSQHGEYDVLFYKFTGMIGKDSAHQLNLLKMQYHFDSGCPYYQVRPILLSTWQQLDKEHQQASSPVCN